jgi:D-glycero-beta-D-manno-heptose 1-phosphate adenylyltransferase
MTNHIEKIRSKNINGIELDRILARLKFKGQKIVFTNGCFDILHRGHVEYLAKAASLGDVLIVGMNTDESIKRLKGPGRPVQDQESRTMILSSFEFVNYIVIFNEDTPTELIKHIRPDILAKGNEYKIEEVVGHDIVQAYGGEVKTIEMTEGYSTSNLINKVIGKK